MENFNCYQDDGYSHKFEFYEDDNCGQKGGKKHEEKIENKNKNEKVKYYCTRQSRATATRCTASKATGTNSDGEPKRVQMDSRKFFGGAWYIVGHHLVPLAWPSKRPRRSPTLVRKLMYMR